MDQLETVISDIRRRMAASPFHGSMGIEILDVGEGTIELGLEASDRHANLAGALHGGVLATLADTATGLAVRSALPPGARHVTVNLDVQFLAPGSTGSIVAGGRVVRLGRRLAFAEAEIRDGSGTTLARAQATIAVSAPAESAQ